MVILLIVAGVSQAAAGGFSGFSSALIYSPYFQAEFSLQPVWLTVASGRKEIAASRVSWELRDDLALVDPGVFLDLNARVQVRRLSFRVHASMRDFAGTTKLADATGGARAEARLEYSGFRMGADLDILRRERSRLGVNVDRDLFRPIFTESIVTRGGSKLVGEPASTVGIHGVYVPTRQFYGLSALFEFRVRRPLVGPTSVYDLEISGGVLGPETGYGAIGLKIGYRSTSIEFEAGQTYRNIPVTARIKATIQGVYGELVYYY